MTLYDLYNGKDLNHNNTYQQTRDSNLHHENTPEQDGLFYPMY